MKHKVGDKVRVKSLAWYNENKDINEEIQCGDTYFVGSMTNLCGLLCTIEIVDEESQVYYLLEDTRHFCWTDEMFEGLAEEGDLIPKFGEYSDNEPLDVPTMTTEFVKEHGFPCPNGYIFKDENGNVINATKIILEKKKKEYPKTYVECCKIIGIKLGDCYIQGYKSPLLEDIQELLICRDAYWKIAGEVMGLDKPWKPDWTDLDQLKYCIWVDVGEFITMTNVRGQHILAFSTEEVRDTFKENFKELIEQCKEFL